LAEFSGHLGSALLPADASDDYTYWFEEVHLALSEALANVILHAYQNKPGHIVDIALAIFSESIEVDMLDDGLPFSAVFPPIPREIDLDNPPEHGFGLHILYQVMEVARYRRIAGTLNHWHFKRSMPDSTPLADEHA
jgi:serine/threonine-protein kinase RsbW